MSGLTPTGFIPQTTAQIQTLVNTDVLATIDAGLDTSPEQPLGQLIGIFAAQLANVWALQAATYNALDPNQAQGVQLDAVCALTGVTRLPAKSTTVSCTVNLNASQSYTGPTLDANGNVITPGQLLANISGHPEYVFTNQGPIVSTGAGNYTVTFVCTQTGPVPCNAGTLTVISPAVGGWNNITNPLGGTIGSAIETDTTLRIRRQQNLAVQQGSTFDSIRDTVLAVAGIIQVTIYENDLLTLGDGVTHGAAGQPGCSFWVIIWDGSSPAASNNAVAQAIWNSKPCGIQAWDGNSGTSGTATDQTGAVHTVGFSRATQVGMWINITVTIGPLYPSNGDTLLQAALAAFGNALTQGQSVIVEAFKAVAFTIAGVLDVRVFQVDSHAGPTNTANIAISANQIATFSTTNIAVSH